MEAELIVVIQHIAVYRADQAVAQLDMVDQVVPEQQDKDLPELLEEELMADLEVVVLVLLVQQELLPMADLVELG